MPLEWTCIDNASGTECVVTATSTIEVFVIQPTSTEATTTEATTTQATTTPMDRTLNATEQLFIAMIIIFLLSMLVWPTIFRPISSIFSKK